MYVRVRDPETRHQFDVPESDPRLADGRLIRMSENRWQASPVIRHPKHHTKLAGRTASRETDAATATPDEATTTEEN